MRIVWVLVCMAPLLSGCIVVGAVGAVASVTGTAVGLTAKTAGKAVGLVADGVFGGDDDEADKKDADAQTPKDD